NTNTYISPTTPHPSDSTTLSLHDALPISPRSSASFKSSNKSAMPEGCIKDTAISMWLALRMASRSFGNKGSCSVPVIKRGCRLRSEEHTSELQSRFDLVCRLLLEKKNNNR